MIGDKVDYEAVLSDLEAKKANIETAIASIRTIMGQGESASTVTSAMAGMVASGSFLGMKLPEAIIKYLGTIKKPQTLQQIAEGVKQGGFLSTSANFTNNVRTSLSRLGDKVHQHGREWGLAEWFPGKKKKSNQIQEGEEAAEDEKKGVD